MIALNELIKNIDIYQNAYKSMGVKINLNHIVKLEEQLKTVQLEAEHSRAACNKLCGEIIQLKSSNSNISSDSHLKNAIELDIKANNLQSKLEKITKKINFYLKKLPNLPDFNNLKHIQIETSKTPFDYNDFKNYLSEKFKYQSSNESLKSFLKLQENKIFSEEDISTATQCKNKILILCKGYELDEIINDFISYFKNNSLSIVERSILTLKNSSSRELFIHLNARQFLKIEIKREFFTREYKIKYHDNKTDSTKFVNQIDLIFN